MALSFEPLFADQTASVSRVRNLVLIYWHGTPRAETVSAFAPVIESLRAGQPNGLVIVTFTRGMPSVPDDATRRVGAQWIRRLAPSFRAAAFVIEDTGFRAAATRAVVTGLLAVVRSSTPVRVFPALDDASAWIAPHVELGREPPEELGRALRAATAA